MLFHCLNLGQRKPKTVTSIRVREINCTNAYQPVDADSPLPSILVPANGFGDHSRWF